MKRPILTASAVVAIGALLASGPLFIFATDISSLGPNGVYSTGYMRAGSLAATNLAGCSTLTISSTGALLCGSSTGGSFVKTSGDTMTGGLVMNPATGGTVPITINAATGQTGHLQQWNGLGGQSAYVSATGSGYFSQMGVGVNPQPDNLVTAQNGAGEDLTSGFRVGVGGYVLNTPSSPSTAGIYGLNSRASWYGTANSPAGFVFGGDFSGLSYVSGAGTLGNLIGSRLTGYNLGTGTISSLYGGYLAGINQGGGTVTNSYGGHFNNTVLAGSTTTNAYGVAIDNAQVSGGGSLGTQYGLFIKPQTTGTTNYAIYSEGGQSVLKTGSGITKGLVVQGDIAQTANLQEWQKNDGTVLLAIGADGYLYQGANRLLHTYGTNNLSLGVNAGNFTTTGTNNVANGSYALNSNTTGSDNTANGTAALQSNTTGANNVAIGRHAGLENVTGSNNTYIGTNSSGSNLTNATAIGYGAVVRQNNAMVLGNGVDVGIGTSTPAVRLDVVSTTADSTNVASFQNAGGTTCTVQPGGSNFACSSDERLKHNILTIPNALDILSRLRGVTFAWNSDPENKKQYGFIAQEVEKVVPELVSTDKDGMKMMGYQNVMPIAVNAIHQVNAKVEENDTKCSIAIGELKQQNIELENKTRVLNGQIAQLKAMICLDYPRASLCEQ